MFCRSRWVYAGSAGTAEAGAAIALAASRDSPMVRKRRMAGQRPTGPASDGQVSSDALEEEDRDLAVGLLLVLGVRRVLRDRALPPLGALRTLGDARPVGVRLGAVLELDLRVLH